jgi:hypothetical protein
MTRDAMEWSDGPGTILGTWTTVSRQKVSLVRRSVSRVRPAVPGRNPDGGESGPWDGIRGPLHPRNRFTRSHPFTAWDILGSGTRPWDRADG